jgi:hypothetical protein
VAKRYDVGRLQRVQRIAGGAVAIPAYPTRAGILEYRDAAGNVRREFRPPEEVFHPDSLATLRYATVTDLHPDEMVSSINWKQHAVGNVGSDVRRDGMFVSSEIVVHEQKTIEAIDKGDRSELSCGYECDYDETPGTFEGQHYDGIQRTIRYNHVGLGPSNWARAGRETALRLDSNAAIAEITDPQLKQEDSKPMKRRFHVDGIDYEIDADESFFQALQKNMGAAKSLIETTAKERDQEKARADAAEARADAAEKKAATSSSSDVIEQQIQLRLDALRLLPSEYKRDGKDGREIMIDAVKASDASFDPEGKSDDYIRARFDFALKEQAKSKSNEAKERLDRGGKSEEESGFVKAQKEYQRRVYDGWKQPLAVNNERN